MNPITALAETLHRAMHRLPGMPDHAEAAARHARAAARASAGSASMNRPRRHQFRAHS
ncbi:MAG: hypothetical protein ABSC16_04930 [Candidatus Dormibacteria bacterium]